MAIFVETKPPNTAPVAGFNNNSPSTSRGTSPPENRQQMTNAFSQIVAVLMRDNNFRGMRLADLEWLVVPAVTLGQFGLLHARQSSETGTTTGSEALVPVALALWAYVSPAVHEQLSQNPNRQIRATEWTCGEIPWLVAVAGSPKALPNFLKQLETTEFKGRAATMRVRNSESAIATVTLTDFLAQQAPADAAA
jgi:hemolysin-activating ACP:hemolysin acyltransferase